MAHLVGSFDRLVWQNEPASERARAHDQSQHIYTHARLHVHKRVIHSSGSHRLSIIQMDSNTTRSLFLCIWSLRTRASHNLTFFLVLSAKVMENSRGHKNRKSCRNGKNEGREREREGLGSRAKSAHPVYRKQISSLLDLVVFVHIIQIQIRRALPQKTKKKKKTEKYGIFTSNRIL